VASPTQVSAPRSRNCNDARVIFALMQRLLVLVAVICVAAVTTSMSFAAALPHGTFTTRLTEASPKFLNGTWDIEFGARGHMTVLHGGEVAAHGTYTTLAGGRLQIEDHSGPVACTTPQDKGPATYHWRLKGNRLTLDVIHDRCGGRETVLTTHPLIHA
jgi:hypothetical protein